MSLAEILERHEAGSVEQITDLCLYRGHNRAFGRVLERPHHELETGYEHEAKLDVSLLLRQIPP